MKIDESIQEGVPVTAIVGRIDMATAADCEAYLMKALQDGRQAMVLDLAAVDYLSSSGIRVLLLVLKQAGKLKLPLTIAQTQDSVLEILEIAGLKDLVNAYPSIDAAIQAVRR